MRRIWPLKSFRQGSVRPEPKNNAEDVNCIIVMSAGLDFHHLPFILKPTALPSRHTKSFTFAPPVAAATLVRMKGEDAMPNDAFYIICPYYNKTLGKLIFCDGLSADPEIGTESSQIKQTFESRKARNECIKKYCSTFNYCECRIALLNSATLEK